MSNAFTQILKTVRTPFIIMTALAVVFLLTFIYRQNQVSAAAATVVSVDGGGGGINYNLGYILAHAITIGSDDNGKTLNSVTLSFTATAGSPTWTEGAVASSELADLAPAGGGIILWLDNGDLEYVAEDDMQITLSSPVYGASNTLILTPATPPILSSDNIYVIAFRGDSSGATSGNSFTVTIGTDGISMSAGSPTLPSAYTTGSFITDFIAPTVTMGGGPQDGQQGVPFDAWIDRVLSEALAPGSVTTSTVTLRANDPNTEEGAPTGSNLCTPVSLGEGNTRIFCNHGALTVDTWYTFTITTGVTDVATNPLATNYNAQFQVGSFAGGDDFNPPPNIVGSSPVQGGTFSTNGLITLNFSRPMATTGVGSVISTSNIQLFATTNSNPTGSNLFPDTSGFAWVSASNTLSITPPSLTQGNTYRLIVRTAGIAGEACTTCVKGSDGRPMFGSDFLIDFTVGASDSTPPSVVGSFPANGATGVDRGIYDISISFSEPVNPATVSTTTVKLYCNDTDSNISNGCDGTNTNAVDGTDVDMSSSTDVYLDSDNRTVHLAVANAVSASSNFYVRLVSGGSGIRDFVGNQLAADVLRTFVTGTDVNGGASDSSDPEVLFANANNYSVFVTFNEPVKVDLVANGNQSTSATLNVVNNLSYWTVETSSDGVNFSSTNLAGRTIRYEGHNKTLIIEGLSLPPNQTFRVTASTSIQDLSNNSVSGSANTALGTVQSSADTGSNLGPSGGGTTVDWFAQGTDPTAVFPQNAMAGGTSRYRTEFRTAYAIPASGKITLSFPTGYTFGATCATLPTDTFENTDINGPGAGTVAFASVACSSVSRTVTLTLGATGVAASERIQFVIQGVINTTVPKDFESNGYTVDIKTYNASNVLLNSRTSMPFFITTPGSRTISGRLFGDDGSGGGTANNGTQDGSEAGASGIQVCLGGPIGFSCAGTDASGDYSFANLSNGFYHIDIPPITSGSFTGGPFFRDLNVSGSNVTGVNFPLAVASAQDTLDVYISGGVSLANEKLDVFAFSSAGATVGPQMGPGGPGGMVTREVTLNGSGVGTTTLPLTAGRWEIGLGPWMPKTPGSAMSVPRFNFIPPRPQQIQVSSLTGVPDNCTTGDGAGSAELCFTLSAASNQIIGKVVDASGAAITNVFVDARPAYIDNAAGATDIGFGTSAEVDATGNFTLNTTTGTFVVSAFSPGMPTSNGLECTVKANTGASDNNATADVYCEGVLMVNDITGFSASSVTLANKTSNDLIFVIKKGDTSISGRVLDDTGAAVTFAHVGATEVDGSGNPIGVFVDRPTDNSGNYTLYVAGGPEGAPKNWRVCAFAPGFGQLTCQTVSVTTGTNVTGRNFQPTVGSFSTITGTIYIDSDGDSIVDAGEGVSGAHVNVFGPNGGNGAATSDDGTFSIRVTSGTGYNIDGFVPGQGPTVRLTGQDYSSDASGVNLKMEQPGTLNVLLCTPTDAGDLSLGCASGQVTDAFVDARKSDGFGNGTSANTTSGIYQIIAPAGTYTVKAHNEKIGEIGSQASVVVAGNGTTYVNFAPPTTYSVSGTVTAVAAACIEGVTVSLSSPNNGRMMLAPADSSGVWTLSGVPAGSYYVSGMKPGCVDANERGTVIVTSANITEANDADLTRTMTASNASISGSVYIDADADNTFDSGENVSHHGVVFATTTTGRVVVADVDITKTGTDTNYTLNLTPGTWTIQARADGYESSSSSVIVAISDNLTRNLRLVVVAGYTRREPQTYSVKPSRGGIVRNTDIGDNFEVNIPAGSLGTSSNDGSVITQPTSAVADTNTQRVIGSTGVTISPKNSSGQPITTVSSSSGGSPTITIPYTDADVAAAGGAEANIIIGTWSEEKQQWEPQSTTCDTVNNTCTATVSHFSTFAPIVTISTATIPNNSVGTTGGGGGGGYVAPSTLTVTAPDGGEQLVAGSTQIVSWSTSGTDMSNIRIKLSSDGGLGFQTTVALNEANDGSYSWTVPTLIGSKFRVKIEGLNSSGITVISDISDHNFSIGPAGEVPTPTPSVDSTDVPGVTSGVSYDKALALGASADINADLNIEWMTEGTRSCESGTLIKSESFIAVYFCGNDGKRYVFPNDKIYGTWYANFDEVVMISDTTLASIQLGGVVKYHPGSRMVKIESDPKVYVVAPNGMLRWVTSEEIAGALYGATWNQWIDDIPVSFFTQYSFGPDITE